MTRRILPSLSQPDAPSFTDFIAKKAQGTELPESDLRALVNFVAEGRALPEQLAAWVMAVRFKGLSTLEVSALTDETIFSGEVLNLEAVGAPKVGFRSIGGLGDPCALVLTPLAAACGAVVPTMQDATESPACSDLFKLQAIPGFKPDLSNEERIRQLKKVRCCFCAQPEKTVPVDQIFSRVRRAIAAETVVPLLASSILSRLLSVGSESVVLDIKKGWLFREDEAAEQLANMTTRTMRSLKHRCVVLTNNIRQPVGSAIGAVFELKDVIELLHGRGDSNLIDLIIKLGMEMVRLSGVCGSTLSAKKTVTEHLNDGSAFETFKAMVKAQGGDISYLDHPEKFQETEHVYTLKSEKRGYVHSIDAALLKKGLEILMQPGKKGGTLDPTVGLCNVMKAGMPVVQGDTLAEIHYNDPSNFDAALDCFRSAYCLTPKRPVISEFEIERFA